MKRKKLKYDFSDIEKLILKPGDKDVPPQFFHGTPATVVRKIDSLEFAVESLYFDGDRNGFVVTVRINRHLVKLFPGTYRTTRLFSWNAEKNKLEFFILD